MFNNLLKNLSILKKFLFINFLIFIVIFILTIFYLKAIQPNLINKKTSNHIQIINNTIDHIKRLAADAQKGDVSEDDAEMEELLLALKNLQEEPLVTVQEGLLFDFPECDSIIIDPMCRQLRGFVGATWGDYKNVLDG